MKKVSNILDALEQIEEASKALFAESKSKDSVANYGAHSDAMRMFCKAIREGKVKVNTVAATKEVEKLKKVVQQIEGILANQGNDAQGKAALKADLSKARSLIFGNQFLCALSELGQKPVHSTDLFDEYGARVGELTVSVVDDEPAGYVFDEREKQEGSHPKAISFAMSSKGAHNESIEMEYTTVFKTVERTPEISYSSTLDKTEYNDEFQGAMLSTGMIGSLDQKPVVVYCGQDSKTVLSSNGNFDPDAAVESGDRRPHTAIDITLEQAKAGFVPEKFEKVIPLHSMLTSSAQGVLATKEQADYQMQ